MEGWEALRSCALLKLMQRIHRLNPTEQRELNARMEKKQMKEFMTVRRIGPHCSRLDLRLYHISKPNTDVFEACSTLFRRLRQRLHHQVFNLSRGRMCNEMR